MYLSVALIVDLSVDEVSSSVCLVNHPPDILLILSIRYIHGGGHPNIIVVDFSPLNPQIGCMKKDSQSH